MKGSTKRGRGVFGSSTQAVQRVLHLLEQSRSATHMRTYEHFCRSLAIWQAALDQVKMAEWLEVCAGMEHGLGLLSQALSVLLSEASSNYEDLLGSVYMVLGQGEKRLGQYFTPFPIAQLMASITLADLRPLEPGQAPIKILEPGCGSGVMILAAAESIEKRYPGMIARGEVQFFGVDRDPICVAMCNLNMRLHGIGRIMTLAPDQLEGTNTATERDADRRLIQVFQPARIVCGNGLDPETDRLLVQSNPWIQFVGWFTPASEEASSHRTVAQAFTEKRVSSRAEEEREERLQEIPLDAETEPVTLAVPEEAQLSASSEQAIQGKPDESRTSPVQKKTRRRRRDVQPEVVQQHLFSPPE